MSPELEKPLRTHPMAVLHAALGAGDLCLMVALKDKEAVPLQEPGFVSFKEAVAEIATGECSLPTVAVIRINSRYRDSELIDNGKLARAVAEYVTEKCDHPDDLWPCPFLDENYPDWRDDFEREWAAEMAGMADAGFYARYGT